MTEFSSRGHNFDNSLPSLQKHSSLHKHREASSSMWVSYSHVRINQVEKNAKYLEFDSFLDA